MKKLLRPLYRFFFSLRFLMQQKHLSWPCRILIAFAVAYLLSPIDLIPDIIPFIGQLDDLVVLPLLMWLIERFLSAETRTARDAYVVQRMLPFQPTAQKNWRFDKK